MQSTVARRLAQIGHVYFRAQQDRVLLMHAVSCALDSYLRPDDNAGIIDDVLMDAASAACAVLCLRVRWRFAINSAACQRQYKSTLSCFLTGFRTLHLVTDGGGLDTSRHELHAE